MRKLHKFGVFILFIALFGSITYGLFHTPLDEMASIVRGGSGDRVYVLTTWGEDGNLYALRLKDDGSYSLVTAKDGASAKEYTIAGLPASFEPDSLFVADNGTVLLGLYERSGMRLSAYCLYAAKDAMAYQLLMREECDGQTAQEQRLSARLVGLREENDSIRMALVKNDSNSEYQFDPEKTQGLVSNGALTRQSLDSLLANTAQVREEALLLLKQTTLYGSSLSIAPGQADGSLVLAQGGRVFMVDSSGTISELTQRLNPPVWQCGLLLLGIVLAVLVVSYSFYYLVCEVNGLYFPLVMRTLLTLGLLAFLLVTGVLQFLVSPTYTQNSRDNVLKAMQASISTLPSQADSASLVQSAREIASTGDEFFDSELILASKNAQGGYAVQANSTGLPDGNMIENAGLLPGEEERIRQTFSGGSLAAVVERSGETFYCVYELRGDDVLIARVNARLLEQRITDSLTRITYFLYGATALLVLAATVMMGGVSIGVRRVIKGVDLLARSNRPVRVVHQSGDEVQALAGTFNDMSQEIQRNVQNVNSEKSSYLRFVPQQLLTFMGAASVEQVSKTTSASHTMAVMVVGLRFAKTVYESQAQALFDNINQVFERIGPKVAGNAGAIYNFTYDGFDAVFENGPQAAISAAVAIRQEILELNSERELRGEEPVVLRIAIDNGIAMMGVVGDQSRMVPTVVSSCLNTARRLVELAHLLDANILCTGTVAEQASEYGVRYLGKGRDGGALIRVYEIFDGDLYEVRLAKENMREKFSSGIYTFYSGDFAQAKRQFMDIARRQSADGAARHYLYLADKFERESPAEIGLN